MAIVHDAPPVPERKRRSWATDNPLVRAVGRLPLPLGAKLIASFLAIGALLALVAALGLTALGRSNSRGEQLRRLQQRAVYFQLVLTDGTQLKAAIAYRIKSPGSAKKFGSGLDQSITNLFNQLCVDVGIGACVSATSATSPPPIALTRLLPTGLFYAVHDNLYLFGAIAGTIPLGPDT